MAAHAPHFSVIVALGIVAFVTEMILLLVVVRRTRARRDGGSAKGTHDLLTILSALGAALLVPCPVAILVSRGRSDLIEQFVGPWHPRFELMTHPLNQIWVLQLGTMVALPSLVLAGVSVGTIAASRYEGRLQRILLYCAAPAVLAPFFLGAWSFLNRIREIVGYPRSMFAERPDETAPAISKALAVANQVLDRWACLAVIALVGMIAWLAYDLVRRDSSSMRWLGPRRTILASASMLAVAGLAWWLSGPLARENESPFPGHSDRRSRRLAPAVPAGLSQGQLHDRADELKMGFYREPLVFPLVHQEEDKWVAIGCRIEVSKVRVSSDGLGIYDGPQELKERLEQCKGNARILHPGETLGSPLIEASPSVSMDLLAEVLAVVYDLGWREIRLVTGVPQTIQRPWLGPLSRASMQTTSVAVMRPSDLESRTAQTAIRVARDSQRYREVIDQVLTARRESRASVLVLDSGGSSPENRWPRPPSMELLGR
jgi:hypothetical protein